MGHGNDEVVDVEDAVIMGLRLRVNKGSRRRETQPPELQRSLSRWTGTMSVWIIIIIIDIFTITMILLHDHHHHQPSPPPHHYHHHHHHLSYYFINLISKECLAKDDKLTMEEFREGSRNDPRIVQVLPTTITIRFVNHEECHNNAS